MLYSPSLLTSKPGPKHKYNATGVHLNLVLLNAYTWQSGGKCKN